MHNGALFAAALLVGLVLLDTTLVIVSRRRRGVALITGGRRHLTHRLLGIVGSSQRVAGSLLAVQLSLFTVALVAAAAGPVAIYWAAGATAAAGVAAIAVLEKRMDTLEEIASVRHAVLVPVNVE